MTDIVDDAIEWMKTKLHLSDTQKKEPTHDGKTYTEIVDEAAGGQQPPATNENASNSGNESSTSGRYSDHGGVPNRTNQSTDHMNQY